LSEKNCRARRYHAPDIHYYTVIDRVYDI
jgi:hypothetical protein